MSALQQLESPEDAAAAGRDDPDPSASPTTPQRAQRRSSPPSKSKARGRQQQRQRESFSADDGQPLVSPGSPADDNGDENDRRAGAKRACNECRQQKCLRCDVVRDPFAACSRCKRYNIDCRIDNNFKRVGKRKRNAEMEGEIAELRAQLSAIKQQKTINRRVGDEPTIKDEAPKESPNNGLDPRLRHLDSPLGQYLGSHDAVDSLMDLKSGGELRRSPHVASKQSHRLEDVVLSLEEVEELFGIYWSCYHPFHPLLNPNHTPQRYLETSQLLFWVVVSVAARKHNPKMLRSLSGALTKLLWATVADVPQNYHVVKALCILCVWPLPISSTSADPTLMACGLMMQISMQIGMHRPGHAQDFSKLRIELREGELRDRLKTWAACNIVAQNVGTGYGQPPISQYDWTLTAAGLQQAGFKLPGEMDARLRIEIFVNKVTKTLYQNHADSVGLIGETAKPRAMKTLAKELTELEQMLKPNLNDVNVLHLRAAWVHLRLAVLFDPPTTDAYRHDLDALWQAVREFLEHAFEINVPPGCSIRYATNYLFQIILASGFVLLKLLNSFFTHMIDIEYGKSLFAQTIKTLREGSVLHNDLPMRLAEVLAQLWQAGGAGDALSPGWDGSFNDSLQLKVTCRMSMSLIFDATWRWRDQFQSKGRDSLESALRNPVNVENISGSAPIAPSSLSHTTLAPHPAAGAGMSAAAGLTAAQAAAQQQALAERSSGFDAMLAPPGTGMGRSPSPGMLGGADFEWPEWSNDVFDPLGWMLDGYLGDVAFMGSSLDGGNGF